MGSACSADSGVREGGASRRGSEAAARPQAASTRQLQTSGGGGGGAADDRPPTPNRHPVGGGSAGPAPSTPLLGLLPARRPLSIHTPATPDLSVHSRFSWQMAHPEILALDINAGSNPTRYLELERQRLSVPQTPTGKEAEIFRFFCPVCMLYFKEILKTNCCSNNVCLPCALSHVKQRCTDPVVESWLGLPSGQSFAGVGCPLCNLDGVQFARVATNERARNYQESPMTKDLFKAIEARNRMELGPQAASMHQLHNSKGPGKAPAHHKSNQSAGQRSAAPLGPNDQSSNSATEHSQSGTGSYRGLRSHAVAELRADMRQHHSLAADPDLEVEHDEDIASPSTRVQQVEATAAAAASASVAASASAVVAASSSSPSSSAALDRPLSGASSSVALGPNDSSSSLPPRPRSGSSRPSSRQLPSDSSRPPRGPGESVSAVAVPAARLDPSVDGSAGSEAGDAMESVPLSSSSSAVNAAAPVPLRCSSPLGGESGRPQGWTAVPNDTSERKFDSAAAVVVSLSAISSSSGSGSAAAAGSQLGVQLPGDDASLRADALFMHSPHAKELRAKSLLYAVDGDATADSLAAPAASSSSSSSSSSTPVVPRQRSHHVKAPSISISSPMGPPLPASHSPVLAPLPGPAAAASSSLAPPNLPLSNSDLLLEESFSFDGSASFMQENGQHAAVHPADAISMRSMQQESQQSPSHQPSSDSNAPSPTAAAS